MSRRAWILFAAMSVLWGVPYLFIKVAVAELSPVSVVVIRTAIASLVLLPVALHRGALRGLGSRWRMLLVLAVLEICVPFLLITAGEVYISSSLTGLLIAAEPLFVAVLAALFVAAERVDRRRFSGLLVGLAGVLALLGFDAGRDPRLLLGAAMVLAATGCYAAGVLLIRSRFADVSPLGVVTASLALATVLLAPGLAASPPTAVPSAEVLGSLVALGTVCTAVAFLVFFALIAEAGASRASVITYVNPAVAVALGVTLLDEPLTAATVAGFLLVLVGSWLSTGGGLPPAVARWAASRSALRPARLRRPGAVRAWEVRVHAVRRPPSGVEAPA